MRQVKRTIEALLQLEKSHENGYSAGLSLQESKALLKSTQEKMVLHQAQRYTQTNRLCPCCYQSRKVKSYHSLQFKTLFGIVVIPRLRLYPCRQCSETPRQSFSVLQAWLPEHTSPELQYIETK